MENELLERQLQEVPRPFTKPTGDPKDLSKRQRLELCKPLIREHHADQEEPWYRESHNRNYEERQMPFYKNAEKRWDFIYGTLEPYRGSGLLNQARHEIRLEDEHGDYRERAYSVIELIEDGWNKWEAYISYPIPYVLAQTGGRWGWDEKKKSSERRKFRSKRRAERWLRRETARYDRYIQRLIDEGVYDDHAL